MNIRIGSIEGENKRKNKEEERNKERNKERNMNKTVRKQEPCRRCPASLLEEEILEDVRLNLEPESNIPFDLSAMEACIQAVKQIERNQNKVELDSPARFETSPLKRIRNLVNTANRPLLFLQGLILAALCLGSWILSLVLAKEMRIMPDLAQGLALGYACSAGMVTALVCLAGRIHSCFYGMDELEAACPYSASGMMGVRIVLAAVISLLSLGFVSAALSGVENLKVLLAGGALTFLLTMIGSVLFDGRPQGMVMSGVVSLFGLLIPDMLHPEVLTAFLSQSGPMTCLTLLAALLFLSFVKRERRQRA